MVNRLRNILGEIISANQSTFVPGRLITDNALVAFECLHYIEQNKKQAPTSWTSLKHMIEWIGIFFRKQCKDWVSRNVGLTG